MNSERLNASIEKSMVSKSSLARVLGISRDAFYKKLRGDREFKCSEISTLSKVLHLTSDERTAIFFVDLVDDNANNAALCNERTYNT